MRRTPPPASELTREVPSRLARRDLVEADRGEADPAGVNAHLGQVRLDYNKDVLSLTPAGDLSDRLVTEVLWNGAPQVRERAVLRGSSLKTVVQGFEDGSLVLGQMKIGDGQVFVITPYLAGANPQLQDWAYYNYLIYHLVERAGGRPPLSFAGYPASPVPHRSEQIVLFALLAVMVAVSFTAYAWVRSRRDARRDDALARRLWDESARLVGLEA